tara:strand:+ start:5932 stop:6273 length:342 start_codon:yes stop_codon:yes gene_type:complete
MAVRFKNSAAALSTTNLTTVYTCPTNFTAIIKEVIVTNVDGSSAADITLKFTDTSASATFDLVSTKSVAADDFLRLGDANIILEAGDIFKAQASAANDLTVSIFIEEKITPAG